VRINLNWNDVADKRPAHPQDPSDPQKKLFVLTPTPAPLRREGEGEGEGGGDDDNKPES